MEPHSVTRYLAELINASTTPWLGTRDHDHMGTVGCFQFFFTHIHEHQKREHFQTSFFFLLKSAGKATIFTS